MCRVFWAFLLAFMLLGASERSASAQELLAQTGTAKTAVGWVIVLLCIGLGLLVVCRPGTRGLVGGKKKKKQAR
jgi:hypothetical protein